MDACPALGESDLGAADRAAGIVENPDEMDGEPWSPELLDWLASDFVEHGYDLKHLIATIVTSRTYQMPAVARKGEAAASSYVFRGPEVRRLTAEQFADAIGVDHRRMARLSASRRRAPGPRVYYARVARGGQLRSRARWAVRFAIRFTRRATRRPLRCRRWNWLTARR